jgi:membrane-bound serine protease (ClpP class)
MRNEYNIGRMIRGTATIFMLLLLAVAHVATAQPATAPAAAPATAPAPSQSAAPTQAAVVLLDGMIDDFNRDSLIKRIDRARELGADTIILQIDTYGGLVTAGLDISRFLKRQDDLHIIAFVDEKAISAGAMIALACDQIVMSPGAQLGDCAPIAMSPTGGSETLGDAERAKAESPILEDFYDSAKQNGYNPLLVQAMVSVGRVVHWVEHAETAERRFVDAEQYEELKAEGNWKPVSEERDPIDRADTLLTVGSDLAVRLGLASGIERSAETLAEQRDLTIIATLAPSTGERFVGFLASMTVRAILTTIFMLSLYMAFSHPGHGAAEAVAMVSLGLLVGVPLLTGYAAWWEIVLILLGLVLLAVEIFLIPGFGVTGITGVCFMLFGLVMTFVGDEPVELPGVLPSLAGTKTALMQGLIIVVTGLACSLLLWVWLQRYLPKMPYVNRLILTTVSGGNVSVADADVPGAVEVVAWPTVGSVGTAVTDLRPGGMAEFEDEALNDRRPTDVVSDSGFVRAGTKVIVREVKGARVVVRAA